MANVDTSLVSAQPVPPSPSSVIGSTSILLDPQESEKAKETQRRSLPSPSDDNKNLRRIRTDSQDQSKGDDSKPRRSIFGHYFKEEPTNPPPPIPQNPQQLQKNQQMTSPMKRQLKRTSWASSKVLQGLPPTPEMDVSDTDKETPRRVQIHNHPSTKADPVDYRLFTPSEEQVAESAICSRYLEKNKEHQKDYDSLVENQVQIEHSLPPFPSPLVRFCSDTTARVAENDAASSSQKQSSENKSHLFSPDGEMHYHGVYSLLKPRSILKRSRYIPDKTSSTTSDKDSSNATTSAQKIDTTQSETEATTDNPSAPVSAINFPRSYMETSAAILKQYSKSTDNPDLIPNVETEDEEEEEKKENDLSLGKGVPASTPISESSSATSTSLADALSQNETLQKDSQDDKEENGKETSPDKQHCRFDPRVTVTEFEDPVPRIWYNETELEISKKEAIVLAQAYLKKHSAVKEWYGKNFFDPVTKTYRKRALFSLPVFSASYKGKTKIKPEISELISDIHYLEQGLTKTLRASPSKNERDPSTPRVENILVIHPYAKIASLFSKSMKSMFSDAKIVTAKSPDKALKLIEDSLSSSPSSIHSATSFDVIIVEQHLVPPKPKKSRSPSSSPKPGKSEDCFNPLGFLDFFKEDGEKSKNALVSPATSSIKRGSDLIYLIQQFSTMQDTCSLIIGVSVKPDRDGPLMKNAGADIVWGIPIPKVGEKLRNKLFSKLHLKRLKKSFPLLQNNL